MAAATRLESLLSLLVSPQAEAEPAGHAGDCRSAGRATGHAADATSLQMRRQHATGEQHAEGPDAVALYARQCSSGTAEIPACGPRSQPLAEQDRNAAAAPDSFRNSSNGGGLLAMSDCRQQAETPGAVTGCWELIATATPRPRNPDARAIPTARHHALTGRQLHADCSGGGNNSLGAVGADAAAAPGERRRWELRITAATQRAQVAEAAATEARRRADAAGAEQRRLADKLAHAAAAHEHATAELAELQASHEQVVSESLMECAKAAAEAEAALRAARADAAAAGAELQRVLEQLQECKTTAAEAQRAAELAVEAAAAARQHDAAAAVSASHAHKQLEVALQRAADDAATIAALQSKAAAAAAEHSGTAKEAADARSAAGTSSSENEDLRRRATAAEGFAAAFRRSAVSHAAAPELAACGDDNLQAYVRLLEQEVAEAAETQAALQQRLAAAPADAAADARQMRERAAAAEAQRAEALQQLQLERHRVAALERLRLEDSRELSRPQAASEYWVAALERLRLEDARELNRLQAAGEAARAAGARLAKVLEAMLLGAAAKQRQHCKKQHYAQHRTQQHAMQQHPAIAPSQAPVPAAAPPAPQQEGSCHCGRRCTGPAAPQAAAADPPAALPPPARGGEPCSAAAAAAAPPVSMPHCSRSAIVNATLGTAEASAATANTHASAAAVPGVGYLGRPGSNSGQQELLRGHPGALPDPAGRLALLQLREALDV